eukprot:3847914-Pleurochrysis_carterae.AAC.1
MSSGVYGQFVNRAWRDSISPWLPAARDARAPSTESVRRYAKARGKWERLKQWQQKRGGEGD